jgi:hypothetical protein
VGQPIQRKCFICCKYLKEDGTLNYRDTSYWCSSCHMPLCNVDRRQPELGREQSCEEEHLTPCSKWFGCAGQVLDFGFIKTVNPEHQINIHPRQPRGLGRGRGTPSPVTGSDGRTRGRSRSRRGGGGRSQPPSSQTSTLTQASSESVSESPSPSPVPEPEPEASPTINSPPSILASLHKQVGGARMSPRRGRSASQRLTVESQHS